MKPKEQSPASPPEYPPEHLWPLFRICLYGFFRRGSCWLLLLSGVVFAWLAPLITPWDEQPQILQPARAQAAWIYVWVACFTWFPFQAATLGRRLRSTGMLELMKARGIGAGSLYGQIGASVAVWLAAVVLLAGGVCITVCLPRLTEEATQWIALVGQYGALSGMALLPLLWLGVAIGTRVDEVVAFLVPVALLFLGLIAAPWIAPLLAGSDAALFQWGWLALPHTHLADLTPRLVFKLGPLAAADFFGSLGCLTLQGVAVTLLGRCLFRTQS